jgi:hypothetical protein
MHPTRLWKKLLRCSSISRLERRNVREGNDITMGDGKHIEEVVTSERKTFAEDLSPQGPIVAFDVALESIRNQTRMLSRALGAADFFGAWLAAGDLKKASAFAARLATATGLPRCAEAIRQLDDVMAVADSMLALAPDPSPETIAAATSTDPHARKEWQSYKRRWVARARSGR